MNYQLYVAVEFIIVLMRGLSKFYTCIYSFFQNKFLFPVGSSIIEQDIKSKLSEVDLVSIEVARAKDTT